MKKAVKRALDNPVLLRLDSQEKQALRGWRNAITQEPELLDGFLPYVNDPSAATAGSDEPCDSDPPVSEII
jgi:hypothetical protein